MIFSKQRIAALDLEGLACDSRIFLHHRSSLSFYQFVSGVQSDFLPIRLCLRLLICVEFAFVVLFVQVSGVCLSFAATLYLCVSECAVFSLFLTLLFSSS